MKNLLLAFALICALGWALPVHSQVTKPAASLEQLKTLKAENQKLIEQQEATLNSLTELLKTAQQLRIFARRS